LNVEIIFRGAAIGLALVLALAPYRGQIAAAAYRAMEAAKEKAGVLSRLAAVVLLIAAAWGVVPMPHWPSAAVAPIAVETPSVEMQAVVAPVADAIRTLPIGDRVLWAHVWTKAAVVVAGDAISGEAAFTDTRSLRAYTALALDISWRRISGHVPGSNEPLRKAVEAAYGQVVGTDVVPVTSDLRARYAEFAKAVAWAGVNGG